MSTSQQDPVYEGNEYLVIKMPEIRIPKKWLWEILRGLIIVGISQAVMHLWPILFGG